MIHLLTAADYREFKPPRQGDVKQWAKVEALVGLGFRFDTIREVGVAWCRYPSTEREASPRS